MLCLIIVIPCAFKDFVLSPASISCGETSQDISELCQTLCGILARFLLGSLGQE